MDRRKIIIITVSVIILLSVFAAVSILKNNFWKFGSETDFSQNENKDIRKTKEPVSEEEILESLSVSSDVKQQEVSNVDSAVIDSLSNPDPNKNIPVVDSDVLKSLSSGN